MTQDVQLRPQDAALLDGESNSINLDANYEIRGNTLESTIKKIKHIYGSDVRFLPLSGKSAGGGVFQIPAPHGHSIIGLHTTATLVPKIRCAKNANIKEVDLDEIIIAENNSTIYAGAAITLQQLNQALADYLGPQYSVLGADLTSYTYAQVGSTFMTGGMGPQRRYFSDSVVEIALHDGDKIINIEGSDLLNYAGTYGWTGLVSAVQCIYHQLPVKEFAFSIPVQNAPEEISRVLNHFSKFVCMENTAPVKTRAKQNITTLILGLEHITVDSMQPLLNSHLNNSVMKVAKEISDKCESIKADGMIFVNGLSDSPIDEVICELVDDATSSTLTIAEVDLDYTYNFTNLNLMQELREAVSYFARNQEPKGRYSYKGHTDANIKVNPEMLESSLKIILKTYQDYIVAVQKYFKSEPLIKGEILVYGHLNPVGIDPHNRITFATENKSSYDAAITCLDELKKNLILDLATICENTGSVFTGGEKGAGSDHELLLAFDRPEAAPKALSQKYMRQKIAIRKASPCFNWRALLPYV